MMKILLFFIIASVTLLPQDSNIEVLSNSHLIYPYQNGKIYTDEKSFDLYSGQTKFYSEEISGKKVIYYSEKNSYLLIANYGFKSSKEDYSINYFLFDQSFRLVTKYTEIAPFDLPHSIAEVSDNGFIILFDPLSYKLKVIDEKGINEISLRKDISFEMERTAFIRCSEDKIVIGVNEVAMNNTEAEAQIDIFIINKTTTGISQSKLKLSVLTGLYIDKDRIFVSGVLWNNSTVQSKTFIYETSSEELIQVKDFNFENIVSVDNGYTIAIGNKIKSISEDGSIYKEISIKSNRIYNLTKADGKLFLTYSGEGGNYFLILNEQTLQPVLEPFYISDKQISNKLVVSKNNELYFQDINSTFIYRMK